MASLQQLQIGLEPPTIEMCTCKYIYNSYMYTHTSITHTLTPHTFITFLLSTFRLDLGGCESSVSDSDFVSVVLVVRFRKFRTVHSIVRWWSIMGSWQSYAATYMYIQIRTIMSSNIHVVLEGVVITQHVLPDQRNYVYYHHLALAIVETRPGMPP